ncbi:MAG TPA: D-alanyl-D-alanine carboxypeptidase/D-alanyl-D-alanine-endopeptidase [Longimicrobium sp.]|jgi:D-alanyl-D-alanine carboxypeptidase/D-alanyl-D-alanine-endopeptidase (penicillin-binding protein 4)|uniref:D-alanyl-D-alanine carboxypeptidase/D-alanyl-D-alanine endopeptidase n=1 Tax=Longimicrobium sp. TaxID=2029185 RepID=UPI002ED7ADE4
MKPLYTAGLALGLGAAGALAAHAAATQAPARTPAQAPAAAPAQAPAAPPQAPAAPAQAGAGPLQAQAEALVGNRSEWTILAWSMDRNEALYAINADSALIPASNNKVYSTVWALATLGPDYRFPTDLLITGPVQNGTLRGNVVIRGSGDPAFGYPDWDKDVMESPRKMAAALQRMGVRAIEGGVMADPSIHDQVNFGPAWPQDTGNGASRYAPTVSGLPFNRNMLWIEIRGGTAYTRIPDVPEIPVINNVRMGGGRAFAVRKPDEDTVRLRGGVGGRGPYRFGVGAYEPAYLAGGAIRQALREAGIQVNGAVTIGATPKNATLVHRHFSIPLHEIVHVTNRHSDNFFAEHLWKAAVAKTTGRGTYAGGGSASAAFFHDRAGVPWGNLWQADGSGLSANNRTSATAMVRTLIYAHKAPWSAQFHHSLPVAGAPDGTLRNMYNGTPSEGNLHAKTGYIRGVRSLSGYVKTAGGETVAFSFIYNGRGTSGSRGVQIALGNLLATYRR